jgi:biopolymer transport protein ExbB
MSFVAQILTELRDLSSGGGWIFWALIALAFGIAYSLVTLWNSLRFPDATVLNSQEWRQLLLRPGSSTETLERLSTSLSSARDPGRYLQEIGQHLFAIPDRRFPFAFVMIGAAPLLGLLGTVSGMFTTFGGMASSATNSPIDVISEGISEALITTETGLVIGVPTLIVCTLLKSRFDDLVLRFRRLESQLLQQSATRHP